MLLQIQNFRKSYNNYPVISIEKLLIDSGIYWFEGINGSGKSTLFRAIAGLIPFEGFISIAGLENNRTNAVAYRRLVNYAYAEPKFPDYISGADVMKFVADTRSADKKQVDELVALFGVENFQKNLIQTYSSGMLKKIALITAFLGTPKLILLDEPFTTIDKQTSELLYELINAKQKEGISFFIASHQSLDNERLTLNGSFSVAAGLIKNQSHAE